MTTAAVLAVACMVPVRGEARGTHEHEGFFLRLGVGAGYTDAKSRMDKQYLAVRGAAFTSDLSIGWTVAGVFAAHLSVINWALPYPHFADDSTNASAWGSAHDETVTLPLVGLGATRYIAPHNVFISGAIGAGSMMLSRAIDPHGNSVLGVDDLEQGASTHVGLGLRLQGGKEWWVSREWGICASMVLDYLHLPDKVDGVSWQTTCLGVMFSATYN
jgi:hypothetical protein